ncbi:hypothetical protein CDAR_561341 [Caerostris darwini]|uniref:Uncharacterized protein n=1 Tax=Caerostris darwini TaxID=1538125 RepID=A0AAV4STE2_9ARAC|nr:hypothetical protein CDAR_561341 [Caerostris darwini]
MCHGKDPEDTKMDSTSTEHQTDRKMKKCEVLLSHHEPKFRSLLEKNSRCFSRIQNTENHGLIQGSIDYKLLWKEDKVEHLFGYQKGVLYNELPKLCEIQFATVNK